MNAKPGDFFGVTVVSAAAVAAAVPSVVAETFAMAEEYSCVLPAEIVTGVEMSWYPSSFRSSVWVPAGIPGIVAGVTPRWTPSMKINAPAGSVFTEREPSVSG
jgi:hypothetical protein